jgi:Domain of unknown function (DUF4157)
MYIKQNKPSGKSASDFSTINQFAPRPFKVEDSLAQDIIQAKSLASQERESSPAPTHRHIPVFSPDKVQPQPASPSLQLKIDPNYQSTIDRVTVQPPVDQSLPLQPKLNIGEPGDKYEQEAERMAKGVVQRIHSTDHQIEQNKKQPQLNSPSENSWLSRMSIQQPEYQPLPPPPRVQMKLTVGPPGQYEQKADRGADKVIQRINALSASAGQSVQCQKNSEEKINAKPEITARLHIEEPERELQAKSIHQRQEGMVAGEVSTDLASAINSAKRGGQLLDPSLQQSMGKAMGSDISGVKVHTDTQADQLNRQIQAKAFTTGQDVFFRQGAYQPASREGQELIAHELTHVLQQRGDGRLKRVQRASVTVTTQQADEASAIIAEVIWKSRCPTSLEVRDEVAKLNAKNKKEKWQVGHKIGWEFIAREMGNHFIGKTIQEAFNICKDSGINLSAPIIKSVERGIGIWADKYYKNNYPENEFPEEASSNMSTGGSVTHLRDAYINSPDYGKEKKKDPEDHKKRKIAYASATMKTGISKPKTKEQKAAKQKERDKIAEAWKREHIGSPLREPELDELMG